MTEAGKGNRALTVCVLATLAGILFSQPLAAQAPAATKPSPLLSLESAFDLLHAGNNIEALAAFSALLERDPKNPDALMGAGFAALRLNDISSAHEFLLKAAPLAPGYPDIFYGLALVLERRGDKAGAVAAMRKAVTMASGPNFRPDRAMPRDPTGPMSAGGRPESSWEGSGSPTMSISSTDAGPIF